VSQPSFQPIAVPPGDINVVTKIRPTNNRSKERDDTVYVSQHPGHNWLHLQAAKETKQTHHAETNKKVTSHTRYFKDRLHSEACVSQVPCSCIRLHIVQIFHQNPLGSLRALESQDLDTAFITSQVQQMWKNVIGFKSRLQVYLPCIQISKPHQNINQGDGYRMCKVWQ